MHICIHKCINIYNLTKSIRVYHERRQLCAKVIHVDRFSAVFDQCLVLFFACACASLSASVREMPCLCVPPSPSMREMPYVCYGLTLS